MTFRTPPEGLRALLLANARWWAAETTILDTYWDWDRRTLQTDLTWLARQCHKELVDGVHQRVAALHESLDHPGRAGWAALGQAVDGIATEHAHLRAFAAVHAAWAPEGTPALDPATVASHRWPENDALMAARTAHRTRHPELGRRAFALTEGGGGSLYASGAALLGRPGIDHAIAAACASVEEDERHHLLEGLDDLALGPDELATLTDLTAAQGRLRLRMRWAQFSGPVTEDELLDLEVDGAEPSADQVDRLLSLLEPSIGG